MHGRKRPFTTQTEIYGDFKQLPCTVSVYAAKRQETDSVYGDRIKTWNNSKVKFSTPYAELYDCRIRSYVIMYGRIWSFMATICVTFQIRTKSE